MMSLDQIIRILIDYKKDYQKAEQLIPELIKLQERGGQGERQVGTGYLRLGEIYLAKKDYAKAKIAFEKCLQIAALSGLDNAKHTAVEGMASYYATVGDFKNAFLQLEQAYYLADQVRNRLMSEKAQQKQALYELKEKNRKIEQLEKDNRNQQIILLLAILATMGGFGVFILVLRNRKIEKQAMQTRLELQERELLSNTIYIEQRNEVLENIKQQIVEGLENKKILGEIERSINFEKDWEKFKLHFEQIHPDFFKKLLAIEPSLTDLDLKQCAYLKLNLSPKQVANLLNVTPHAVSTSRTRIKKRLNLAEEESLADFLNRLH